MPRAELNITEIINVVRRAQNPAVLEAYQSAEAKCPECGVGRKVVKGKPTMSKKICTDECLKYSLEQMIENDDPKGLIEEIARSYAIENDLPNGQTIHYLNDDYRNSNLLFWDKQNQTIVYPFTEADDYGSVPPIFPVGDGYFNPTDWLDEVEHNSMVFPSITLIREMKDFVKTHPGQKRMIVEINGTEYMVVYNEKEMAGEWDSCVLSVNPAVSAWGQRLHKGLDILEVSPGLKIWRKNIVEDDLEQINASGAVPNVSGINISSSRVGGTRRRSNRKNYRRTF